MTIGSKTDIKKSGTKNYLESASNSMGIID